MEYNNILHINNFSFDMIRIFLSGSYLNESGSMKCVYLLNFLGINTQAANWTYSCGAQYIVPVNFILKKSLNWWKNVYRVYDFYLKYNLGDPGLLFEFIWTLIWNFEEKEVDSSILA
jgi:hypothetical protein